MRAFTLPAQIFPRLLSLAALAFTFQSAFATSLTLTRPTVASNDSLLLVGRTITFAADSDGSVDARYRFRVRPPGGEFQMIRDFGPMNMLDWATLEEGVYEMEVSMRNIATGESSTASVSFEVSSRANDGNSGVFETSHPLVFLFSAPACEPGSRMRVDFKRADGPVQHTPFKDCAEGKSMNFYLAGLYAETGYTATGVVQAGANATSGQPFEFTTGIAPQFDWSHTVNQPAAEGASQPFLLALSAGSQIATDLAGRVVWYNTNPMSYGTRFDAGGYLWGFLEDGNLPIQEQAIRKVDLLGNVVLETNAEQVNEQLKAFGKSITSFHHEVFTLPDGRIAALAATERMVTDSYDPGTINVLGDIIVVFDRNLNVEWVWDSFDHMDVSRRATLDEMCTPTAGGCPPFYLTDTAADWTHSNSVQYTPDGNFLISVRHQDWLVKVAFENGAGDGHMIWRLGKDGDFSLPSNDPYPWFSHQHDGNFISGNRVLVYDNGNNRIVQNGGTSRGQVLEIDEAARTATLAVNIDLGVNAIAVGSAQALTNGNYHFNSGFVPSATGITAFTMEAGANGQIFSVLEAKALIYRSIRLSSLYSVD